MIFLANLKKIVKTSHPQIKASQYLDIPFLKIAKLIIYQIAIFENHQI